MFRLLGITLLLIIISSQTVFSQKNAFDKKSKFLAGYFSLSNANGSLYPDDGVTNIKFNAVVGAFIEKGLILGCNFSLNRVSSCGYSNTQFAIGPQIYYFLGDKTKNTLPYIKGGASLMYYRSSRLFSQKGPGTSFHLGAGVCHLVSDTIGLFSEVSYDDDEISTTEKGTKFNFTVGISTFIF